MEIADMFLEEVTQEAGTEDEVALKTTAITKMALRLEAVEEGAEVVAEEGVAEEVEEASILTEMTRVTFIKEKFQKRIMSFFTPPNNSSPSMITSSNSQN